MRSIGGGRLRRPTGGGRGPEQSIEPLPDDVAALLERARDGVEPPEESRERLRSRLRPVFIGLPLAPPAGNASSLVKRAARSLARAAASTASKKLPLALIGFGLGAGSGVGATLAVQGRRHVAAPLASSGTPPVSGLAAPPPPRPMPSPVTVPPPRPVRHRAAAAAPSRPPAAAVLPLAQPQPRDERLAAERALLEKGRTALTRGDAPGSLAVVADHARRFPDGELAEEREALRIQALLAEDRRAEALAVLGAFRRRFPGSLLLPALDRELEPP